MSRGVATGGAGSPSLPVSPVPVSRVAADDNRLAASIIGHTIFLHGVTRGTFDRLRLGAAEEKIDHREQTYWTALATRRGARLEVRMFTDEPPA